MLKHKKHIFSCTRESLAEMLKKSGQPAFRLKQVCDWAFAKRVSDFEQMRNVPKDLRTFLEERIVLRTLEEVDRQSSANGLTEKWLFKTHDGHGVETVLIREDDRRTVCVSCALGCRLGCLFCASARGPWIRTLEMTEMVEQVARIEEITGEHVTNVVFMGSGEPFLNYDEVLEAARLLNSPDGFNIGARHITISTVGIVNGIERFAGEPEDFRLAISLHAPTQKAREKVIPSAKKYELSRIISAIRRYTRTRHREVTFEYILIAGFNAHQNDALTLAELLKGLPCKVNLIPYNPVKDLEWETPDMRVCKEFAGILKDSGIRATLRVEKGRDIAAACGQLRAHRADNVS